MFKIGLSLLQQMQKNQISSVSFLSSSPTKLTTHQYNGVFVGNSWSVNNEIAFVSDRAGSMDLWKMNHDGTNPIQLTNSYLGFIFFGAGSWSPDGSKLAFFLYRDSLIRLVVMNADGSGKQEILSPDGNVWGIIWSPDGTKILYFREPPGSATENLWVINSDGTGLTQLTTNSDGAVDHASWSPDGTKIVYSGGGPKIYIMDSDGSNKIFLTEGDDPDWSPDGNWIAYEGSGIYKIKLDGTGKTQLTTFGRCPFWTPDSGKIIYCEFDGINEGVWAVTADGSQNWQVLSAPWGKTWGYISPDSSRLVYSNTKDVYTIPIGPPPGSPTNLTNNSQAVGGYFSPLWSPDGEKIFYRTSPNEGATGTTWSSGYGVMNRNGSGKKEILTGGVGVWIDDFVWSPDGTKIAFSVQDVFFQTNVWVINSDGTGLTQLTTDGDSDEPTWSPGGNRIAYTNWGFPPDGIYIMDSDGSNKTFLTEGDDPDWSPDGNWIAYTYEDSGIYKIKPDGTGKTQLTGGDYDGHPAWSPDGSMIAYEKHVDLADELRIVTADGSQNWPVYSDIWWGSFSWSPDSSKIAFISGVPLTGYMANVDGTGLTRINPENTTLSSADGNGPDWSSQNVLAYDQNIDIWINDFSAALPTPPTSLTAVATSQSQINLSWQDNSDNEDGFKVERKTGTSGAWSQIATVGANVTTYQDTGLSSNTTYYYRVRAYNSNGNSAYSNEASAITLSVSKDEIIPYNNLFNPAKGEKTQIKYVLSESGHVTIRIYNLNGELIKELVDEDKSAGVHWIDWFGKNEGDDIVASGVYLVHIEADGFSDIKKIIVVK